MLLLLLLMMMMTRFNFGDDDDNCQAAEGTGEPGTKSSFEKNKDKGD